MLRPRPHRRIAGRAGDRFRLLVAPVVVAAVEGKLSPSSETWTAGRCEPRVCVGGAGMAYAQGGRDGQALAMQTPTPSLAAPARRKRPVVPRMPRLREGTHRHLQGRPQALAVAAARTSDHYWLWLRVALVVVTVAHRRLGPARQPRPRRLVRRCRPRRSMPAAGVGPGPRPGCPWRATARHARPGRATRPR